MRRTDGDETWIRLQTWTKGQKAAERLSAHILNSDGYSSIDPSHPLGGRDGIKDIVCIKNGVAWIAACYFPREQKHLKEIKDKFINDFAGVKKNNAGGIAFITNQELSLGERKILIEYSDDCQIEIYHLERIAHLLDCPENYGVRLEFLDIEITKEEQLSYFVHKDNELHRLCDMVESLALDYKNYKNSTDTDEQETRSEDEIANEINELFDKVWYDRHQGLKYQVENEGEYCDPEIWKGALKAAKQIEEKYKIENLGPWTDFEWGMINGKLSALRWFFGDEWDMLDT
ncbi:PilZ domain-containing protein [Clostridium estertheticum]|uniref:PilZ domain-containing protein n=1 Tax=Clostridium estertheticum TaxID=238834 RepID=UPI001C0D2265|nr:PilZ domain-containing protein [Clostridium estertheticum]MBU3171140.1 PilZ domain-containing protein [Clostridium estertheticum]